MGYQPRFSFFVLFGLSGLVLISKAVAQEPSGPRCDFESTEGYCGWENDPQSAPWYSTAEAMPVGGSPFAISNAASGGHFLYTNGSDAPNGAQVARLVGPPLRFPDGKTTIELQHLFYGPGAVELSILIKRSDLLLRVFAETATTRNWRPLRVEFCFKTGDQVVIEASWAFSNFVFGVDDVQILAPSGEAAACPPEETVTNRPTLPPPTSRSSTRPATEEIPTTTVQTTAEQITVGPSTASGPISCDFDSTEQFCGWDTSAPGFVNSSSHPGIPERPGMFFVVSSSNVRRATLTSRPLELPPTQTQYIQFDYATSGRGAQSLDVFLVVDNVIPSAPLARILLIGGSRPWTTETVQFSVPDNSHSYRLHIVASMVLPSTFIALDNILLAGENGATILPAPASTSPPTFAPLVPVIPAGTCGFDTGLCDGWSDVGDILFEIGSAMEDNRRNQFLTSIQTFGGPEYSSRLRTANIPANTAAEVTFRSRSSSKPERPSTLAVFAVDGSGRKELFRTDISSMDWTTKSAKFCFADGPGYFLFEITHQQRLSLVDLDEVITAKLTEEDGLCNRVTEVPTEPTLEPTTDATVPSVDIPACATFTDQPNAGCSFDSGLCEPYWHSDPNTYPFEVITGFSGLKPFEGAGFAYIPCTVDGQQVEGAQEHTLDTPDIEVSGGQEALVHVTFRYSFLAKGGSAAALKLLLVQKPDSGEDIPPTVFSVDQGLSSQWRKAEVAFLAKGKIALRFLVRYDECNSQQIAIDAVRIKTGSTAGCTEIPVIWNNNVTCDFESGNACGWQPSSGPNRWKLSTGQTGSEPYAVPSAFSGDYYLSLDSNAVPNIAEPSDLLSVVLPPMQTTLKFWNRMHGFGINGLNVYAIQGARRYLLHHEAPSGRQWVQAVVPICMKEAFSLQLEGVFSARGFVIAVDDTELEAEATNNYGDASTCLNLEVHTTVGLPTTTTRTTTPTTTSTAAPTAPSIMLPQPGPPGSAEVSCDFNAGTSCGWSTVRAPNSVEFGTKFEDGRGILVATNEGHPSGRFARVVSAVFPYDYPSNATFELEYLTSGGGVSLNIYAVDSEYLPSKPTYSIGSVGSTDWTKTTVEFELEGSFLRRIVIEARFLFPDSWVALDQVKLLGEFGELVTSLPTSPTQAPLRPVVAAATCASDYGLCDGWTTAGPLLWQASTDEETSYSGRGFLKVAPPQSRDLTKSQYAELQSPRFINRVINEIDQAEVSFWYYTGEGVTELELYTVLANYVPYPINDLQERALVWHSLTKSSTGTWKQAKVTICYNDVVSLLLRVTAGKDFTVVAIDEFVTDLSNEPVDSCTQQSHPSGLVTCDFEEDTCSWGLVNGPNYWKRGSGPSGPGPYAVTGGLTAGESYLYLSSDDLPSPATVGEIKSKVIPSQSSAISFWYRAHGFGVNSLTLFAEARTGRYLLWETTSSGREWERAVVKVCMLQPIRLLFQARFSAPGFYIGIDDVVLREPEILNPTTDDCTLLVAETTVVPPTNAPSTTSPSITTTPTSTVAPIILPPSSILGPISCDFDDATLCGWNNVPPMEGSLEWKTYKDSVEFPFNPYRGAGHAGVTRTMNSTRTASLARLISPKLNTAQNEDKLVEFYYRTGGRGSLGVVVYVVTGDTLPTKPTYSTGPVATNQWNRATILLPHGARLVLETRLVFPDSWTAIDEIRVDGEQGYTVLPGTPTVAPEPLDQLIPAGTCSFDYGLCGGWRDQNSGLSWKFTSGDNITGISVLSRGLVVATNKITFPTNEPSATLQTGLFQQGSTSYSGTAKLSFKYAVGVGVAEVRVRGIAAASTQTPDSSAVILWKQIVQSVTEQDVTWLDATVDLCLDTFNVFEIQVVPGKGFTFTAVDEVVTVKDQAANIDACVDNSLLDSISCNFEDNFCSWRNSQDASSLRWLRTLGSSIPSLPASKFHLTASVLGSLINKKAVLFSGQLPFGTNGIQRIEFVYRIEKGSKGYLSFGYSGYNEVEPLWKADPKTYDSAWHYASVIACRNDGERLAFSTDITGASLDEVMFKSEPANDLSCPTRVSCSFDEGWCDWQPERNSASMFFRNNRPFGPASQPQNGTHYLAALTGSNYDQVELDTAVNLKLSGSTLFSFWYVGGNLNTATPTNDSQLLLMKRRKGADGDEYETIWSDADFASERTWKMGVATICEEQEFSLHFRANLIARDASVGLDSFELLNEDSLSGGLPSSDLNCPGKPETSITCDFESEDLCGWTNIDQVTPWVRSTGRTGQDTLFSIPGAGNGQYYLAALANYRPFGNSVAKIVSRPTSPSMPKSTRVTFWYHMKGTGIRYMKMSLRKPSGKEVVLWEKKGHQGLTWMQADVSVCSEPGSRLVFEASFSLPDHQVGLDNIVFHGESDPSLVLQSTCGPAAPVAPVTCDFDSSDCGWALSPGVKRVTVPEWDDEERGSHYLLISRSASVSEKNAMPVDTVTSPVSDLETDGIFTFWYRINNLATVELSVLERRNGEETENELFNVISTSTETGAWTKEEVAVAAGENITLMIRVQGLQRYFVYLDDLALINEAEAPEELPDTPTTPRPTTTSTTEAITTGSEETTVVPTDPVTSQETEIPTEPTSAETTAATTSVPVVSETTAAPTTAENATATMLPPQTTSSEASTVILVTEETTTSEPGANTTVSEGTATSEVAVTWTTAEVTFTTEGVANTTVSEGTATSEVTVTWTTAEAITTTAETVANTTASEAIVTTTSTNTTETTTPEAATTTTQGIVASTTNGVVTTTKPTDKPSLPTQQPPTRPTTKPPKELSQQDVIIISVSSVAGALVLLASVMACIHCRSTRRKRFDEEKQLAKTSGNLAAAPGQVANGHPNPKPAGPVYTNAAFVGSFKKIED